MGMDDAGHFIERVAAGMGLLARRCNAGDAPFMNGSTVDPVSWHRLAPIRAAIGSRRGRTQSSGEVQRTT